MKVCQQQQLPVTAASSSHLTTMESLALPQELYWDGKSEPNSPPSSELPAIATDLSENWLYDDDFANEILLLTDEDLELKPGAEILYDLIDGDELCVVLNDLKDGSWPPQTAGIATQIPAYSDLDHLVTAQGQNLLTKQYEITYNENVLDANSLTSLTPPQSPPRNGAFQALHEQHDNTSIQFHTLHYRPTTTAAVPVPAPVPVAQVNAYIASDINTELQTEVNNTADYTNNVAAATAIDVKNEYEQAQIVDKIIEEFAKDLPDLSDEYESQYSYSPASQNEESTMDEEWSPSNSTVSSPARCSSSASTSSCCSGDEEKIVNSTSAKKRRPYGRGVEDRKIRKKEQNKNAATRYRQKKKVEMELVLNEEQQLTQRNEELKSKFAKYDSEVKYLKGLIREFYRKKQQV